MAQKQVGARTEGDVFQGMFFWLQAAQLLHKNTNIVKVALEFDKAAGVDDVAVWYSPPGSLDAGRHCGADFYQIKYHVDRSQEYDSEALCDPDFIGAKSSLLQRFHNAHVKLQAEGCGWYRLHLVSNWQWKPSDPLFPLLRESQSGALPEKFFNDGPTSKLGRIRKKWQTHLGLDDVAFNDFSLRLRIDVNYLARGGLRDLLSAYLALAGLKGLRKDQAQNVYDSLAQHFVMDGVNEFDATAFRDLCSREDLFDANAPLAAGPPVIGIRSFMRFADRLEAECEKFVCVADRFNGRHIQDPAHWHSEILPAIQGFLQDPAYRGQERHIRLDCHTSIAFLAGYELDRKSGAQVYPVQKGAHAGVWKPSSGVATGSAGGGWLDESKDLGKTGTDVAIAVSVSQDVLKAVETYAATLPELGVLVDVRPEDGVGASSIKSPDHALALADSLAGLVRKYRPKDGGRVHLFIAAPNGLTFFLAQHRAALGKIQLYEFDFEEERGGSYSPSIQLPA